MRTPILVRLNRGATYDREPPARRLAVILSILFLLSLASVAMVTTMRAKNVEQDSARIAITDASGTATH